MIVEDKKITPSEGMMLYNGQVYSNMVFLGTLDSADNWEEVPYSQYEEYLKEQEEKMTDYAPIGGEDLVMNEELSE